ncbi:bacteriophage abortive infection AbiH family protein [Clostridium sp. YIM B02569]|uniref:bacteriophage abortive infection AbiH family protein n=1 Tax=Clostridium sp. YIM B02569 TaxID=2911967 RepID=UPI001EE9D37A|nr:bacteriophage abortive infection AbiH family protein [Clostridium sp. YIM B02569]
MNILVIGNGFDLEHGLPTKYGNFLDFIKGILSISKEEYIDCKDKFREEKLDNVEDTIKQYLLSDEVFNDWKENNVLKELITLSKDNIWITYFSEDQNYREKGWIDFESEICNVIMSLDYMKKYRINELNAGRVNEMNCNQIKLKLESKICDLIVYAIRNKERNFTTEGGMLDIKNTSLNNYEYSEKIIKRLNTHLNDLIRCLEIYLEEFIRKIDKEYISPDIKDIKFDKVLSFNYTNTYERIYGFNSSDIEYHYIHGKADISRVSDENNMVLGIDEYLGKKAKNKELEFIAFKKYFQRIYKKTGNEYKKWIKKMENNNQSYIDSLKGVTSASKNKICIFGHSLDITDKDIIKELIECPNTETTIFYYNKYVYAQQITNMVKIIGQDELIKRVSGANPTIIFKQQQKRIRSQE